MSARKGFTLIEVLIVVMIIAVVFGIVAFSVSGVRSSARDDRRRTDLSVVASALEKYRSDCGLYPTTAQYNGVAVGASLTGNGSAPACLSSNIYLRSKPGDLDTSRSYFYNSSGRTFILCASLESLSSPIAGCTSCGSGVCNYSVSSQ